MLLGLDSLLLVALVKLSLFLLLAFYPPLLGDKPLGGPGVKGRTRSYKTQTILSPRVMECFDLGFDMAHLKVMISTLKPPPRDLPVSRALKEEHKAEHKEEHNEEQKKVTTSLVNEN